MLRKLRQRAEARRQAKLPAWARGRRGNIFVSSIGANVRPVPGSTTEEGAERIRRSAEAAYASIRKR